VGRGEAEGLGGMEWPGAAGAGDSAIARGAGKHMPASSIRVDALPKTGLVPLLQLLHPVQLTHACVQAHLGVGGPRLGVLPTVFTAYLRPEAISVHERTTPKLPAPMTSPTEYLL
jgi:hypothetical protein